MNVFGSRAHQRAIEVRRTAFSRNHRGRHPCHPDKDIDRRCRAIGRIRILRRHLSVQLAQRAAYPKT